MLLALLCVVDSITGKLPKKLYLRILQLCLELYVLADPSKQESVLESFLVIFIDSYRIY